MKRLRRLWEILLSAVWSGWSVRELCAETERMKVCTAEMCAETERMRSRTAAMRLEVEAKRRENKKLELEVEAKRRRFLARLN